MIDKQALDIKYKDFKNQTGKTVYFMSTLDKKSVSNIKTKLLNYVS